MEGAETMTRAAETAKGSLRNVDKFFIGGQWVQPSSTELIDVIDSGTEELFFQVAEAKAADMDRAVTAARRAFDEGPWPRLTHAERAGYLRALAAGLRERAADVSAIWPRQSGALEVLARGFTKSSAKTFEYYADLADSCPFERPAKPTAGGEFGPIVQEPAGVVGAIIPWNSPIATITYKIAPALLAGCTVVLAALAGAECFLSGQVCSSLTRIVVSRNRHDELVEALATAFSQVALGSPYDPDTQMGPLAMSRQRDRVESCIAKGVAEGATLATGGGRPQHLDCGWYVEPTVFGNVDNHATIAQEEIFGPVLSVIPAADERGGVRIANDTIYGLNSSVFTQ
jgi:acyl-CoA reductase-like NAD-dependent aldehyde dehydrogenase